MNFLTRIFAAIVFSVGLLPSFGQETAPKEVVDKVSAETMAAAAKHFSAKIKSYRKKLF